MQEGTCVECVNLSADKQHGNSLRSLCLTNVNECSVGSALGKVASAAMDYPSSHMERGWLLQNCVRLTFNLRLTDCGELSLFS